MLMSTTSVIEGRAVSRYLGADDRFAGDDAEVAADRAAFDHRRGGH